MKKARHEFTTGFGAGFRIQPGSWSRKPTSSWLRLGCYGRLWGVGSTFEVDRNFYIETEMED